MPEFLEYGIILGRLSYDVLQTTNPRNIIQYHTCYVRYWHEADAMKNHQARLRREEDIVFR